MQFNKTKGLVSVAAAALMGLLSACSDGTMDPATVKTLAVMPFEDLTAQKDFSDLADGVTERLSIALGTARNLNVIAPNTALEYRLRLRSLPEIRERLGADAVLEGGVNIAGETVTINAWIRDTASGKRVWEKQATGKREATFVLADRLAGDASQWLNKPLRTKMSIAPPNWQYFLFLLEGRKLLHRTEAVDVNLALYDLEKLRGDHPDFWPARTASAELFGRLVAMEYLTRDKAREWVKGIVYDSRQEEPESAEAYYAEGTMKYYVDWDWAAAETALKKAIEARPNLIYAWHALAQLYVTMNRKPLALETMEKARKLDPLGYATLRELAAALAANERWDEALKALDEAAQLTKDERTIAIYRGLYLYGKGDDEGARLAVASIATGDSDLAGVQALYGAIQARLGRVAETKKMIEALEGRPKRQLVPADPLHFALLHLALGESAKAYAEMESAIAARRTFAQSLGGNPAFSTQYGAPRFQELTARIAAMRPIQ